MTSTPSLLRVDSSIHSAESVTRAVADRFEEAWTEGNPTGRVVRRDVGLTPLPYLTETEHTAMFVPVEYRTEEHNAAQERAARLAEELLEADVLLVTAPLYNLGVPAGLKTWLDHIFCDIRLFPGFGITYPLKGRTAVIISARGGAYGPGTPMDGWDYENPYMRRQLVDILGYELHEITVDLTMAHLNPKIAHLTDIAVESRADALVDAARLGQQLAGVQVA